MATPVPSPSPPVKIINVSDTAPLTDRERAMLELIKNLQERVTKLEAAQATAENKEQVPPKSPSVQTAAVTTQNIIECRKRRRHRRPELIQTNPKSTSNKTRKTNDGAGTHPIWVTSWSTPNTATLI